jgi:hypothetical protein
MHKTGNLPLPRLEYSLSLHLLDRGAPFFSGEKETVRQLVLERRQVVVPTTAQSFSVLHKAVARPLNPFKSAFLDVESLCRLPSRCTWNTPRIPVKTHEQLLEMNPVWGLMGMPRRVLLFGLFKLPYDTDGAFSL